MKRLTALILILTLMSAPAAMAATGAPTDKLEQRILEQYRKSGFYADLTADIKGEGMEYIDAATWAMMSAVLPGAALRFESTIRLNNRESTLSLSRGDAELSRAVILENGLLTLFQSDLLSDRGAWYSVPAAYGAADLIASVRGGEDGAWPSMAGVVYAVVNAPAEWQTRAGVYMNAYLTDLGLWMQKFTKVAIVPAGDGTTLTEMTCAIPGDEVKRELQAMLVKLYGDNALLTLLREVLTADEAAAYLNAAAQPALSAMVDALVIDGDATVIRRFNAQGKAIQWSISLPFAPSQAISRLTFASETAEHGDRYDIEIAFNPSDASLPGAKAVISAVPDAEGAYTGDLILTLPTAADAFTVVEEATRELRYTYYFYCDLPEQTYDFANDRAERAIDVMLALTPAQGNDGHRHSATLHADFSSRSSNTSPTRLNASLSLMDLTADSGLTFSLTARTAVAWTPETVISSVPAASVTRLEQLSGEGRTALLTAWRQSMTGALTAAIAQLIPYTVTDNDVSAP